MNIQDIKGLNAEGIERHLTYLGTIIARAQHYHTFSNMIEGQFLLADLRTQRDHIRDLYKLINLDNHTAAVMLLAKLQASEEVVNAWIAKLTSQGEVEAEAVREVETIREYVLKRNKESSAEVRTSFVPTNHTQPEEKSHGNDTAAVDGKGNST